MLTDGHPRHPHQMTVLPRLVHRGFDELAEQHCWVPRLGMVRVSLFSMDRMGHGPA
jgi:hypothetical protein